MNNGLTLSGANGKLQLKTFAVLRFICVLFLCFSVLFSLLVLRVVLVLLSFLRSKAIQALERSQLLRPQASDPSESGSAASENRTVAPARLNIANVSVQVCFVFIVNASTGSFFFVFKVSMK
jgi:hypothetical protein